MLMRNCTALMVIASALLVGAAASARPRNPYGGGTRLPEQGQLGPRAAHETRIALKQLGDCLAKRKAGDVRRYLLEDLNEQDTVKLRARILDGSWNCLEPGQQLGTIPMTFQGVLADAMLGHDRLLSAPIDPARIPPLRHSDLSEFPDSLKHVTPAGHDMMVAMDVLFRFGECVVRADVQDAFAILTSRPDSAEESAAFARLMPALPGCIEKNQKVTADKTTVRATIAYNYYRLAAAGQPISASLEHH